MLSAVEKKRILITIVIIGILCIATVLAGAFAAEIKAENNTLTKANTALQGEVDTLSVQIKTSNSIDHIEDVAINQLGMVYPDSDECVYVTDKDKAEENLGEILKEDAYN